MSERKSINSCNIQNDCILQISRGKMVITLSGLFSPEAKLTGQRTATDNTPIVVNRMQLYFKNLI